MFPAKPSPILFEQTEHFMRLRALKDKNEAENSDIYIRFSKIRRVILILVGLLVIGAILYFVYPSVEKTSLGVARAFYNGDVRTVDRYMAKQESYLYKFKHGYYGNEDTSEETYKSVASHAEFLRISAIDHYGYSPTIIQSVISKERLDEWLVGERIYEHVTHCVISIRNSNSSTEYLLDVYMARNFWGKWEVLEIQGMPYRDLIFYGLTEEY